jgi:hypothetical protein
MAIYKDDEGNEKFSKPFNGNPTLKEVITQLVEIYKKHGDMPVAIVEDEGGYIQEQHYARMVQPYALIGDDRINENKMVVIGEIPS